MLKQLVADNVDWYLDELVSEMEILTGKKVSVPTLWRSLRFCGITRKKVNVKKQVNFLYYYFLFKTLTNFYYIN